MKYTILVVDDEKNIRDITRAYLESSGYHVLEAKDGKEALASFDALKVDLIILDTMMPKINGLEVLEVIRRQSQVPIIMLTAKVAESDLINGLSMGADDYIKKPFSMRELMVRIEALIRRTYGHNKAQDYSLDNGNIVIDFNKLELLRDQKVVDLTPNEFRILKVFVDNKGIVLSREQLIHKAFGIAFDGYDRTIDTYIKTIRQKLEENSKCPKLIKTVYGMGYKLS